VFIDDVTQDIYLLVKVTVVSSFVCRQNRAQDRADRR